MEDGRCYKKSLFSGTGVLNLKWWGNLYPKKSPIHLKRQKLRRVFLDTLFGIAFHLYICKGFPVVGNTVLKNTEALNEIWCHENRVTECRIRSSECYLICPPASNCTICERCNRLRNNTKRIVMDKIQANEDMYTCKDKSKKPESLMSREELIEKIHDEKRKRLKLEKRERYRKIQEEMQEFEESDHDDFITMFRSVGQEQLSEEMLVSGKRKLTPSSAKALRGADGTPSKFQKVHANIQGPTNKKNCWETLINYSGTLYHEKPGTTNPCHNKHILQSFETI